MVQKEIQPNDELIGGGGGSAQPASSGNSNNGRWIAVAIFALVIICIVVHYLIS